MAATDFLLPNDAQVLGFTSATSPTGRRLWSTRAPVASQ
jgi:hypothetical protein